MSEQTEKELSKLLLEAVKLNDFEQCKKLIDMGADVNYEEIIDSKREVETNYKLSCLGEAARMGNLELCKFLVEKGAKLKVKTPGFSGYGYKFISPALYWGIKISV